MADYGRQGLHSKCDSKNCNTTKTTSELNNIVRVEVRMPCKRHIPTFSIMVAIHSDSNQAIQLNFNRDIKLFREKLNMII